MTRTQGNPVRLYLIVVVMLLLITLMGCRSSAFPDEQVDSLAKATATELSRIVTETPPEATPTPLGVLQTDYTPVVAELESYLTERVYDWGFDLGVAFVDIQTDQVISVMGDRRYHAMSSFKGPLAVRYFQQLETGSIEPMLNEARNLDLMLRVSYNQSTTCFFNAIGGVPEFNDWLAEIGFDRLNNFVFRWDEWACPEPSASAVPLMDERYYRGDPELGLPENGELLRCVEPQLPCDKAFTPIELAQFYARLYRGEFISDENLTAVLEPMKRGRDESVFWIDLPDETPIQVYTKGGTHEATEIYRVHFFNEAGIIVTEKGAFSVAMFMQRQSEWPGTFPMARAFSIFYDYFISQYES